MQLLTALPQPASRRSSTRRGRARKGEGSLRLRGNTYWYRIPNPIRGQPPLEGSCKTTDLHEAILAKAKALADSRGEKKAVTAIATAQSVTIGELIDDYWGEIEAEHQHREREDADYDSERVLHPIRITLKRLREGFAKTRASELTSDSIKQYRGKREKTVLFSTVNHEMRYLKAVLRRGTRQTPPKVTHVPYIWMPSEKSQVREGFVERDKGCEEILTQLPDSLKAIHVCGFHVGARCGELKKLRWAMVNWQRKIIQIRPKTSKTKEGRTIPIWGDMEQILLWQKSIRDRDFPNCPWVFFWHLGSGGNPGGPLGDFRIQYSKAAARAGYPSTIFHDLRRSAVKYAVQEAGIDGMRVRHMTGHKTDTMLHRYNIGGEREMENLGHTLNQSLKKRGVVRIRRQA